MFQTTALKVGKRNGVTTPRAIAVVAGQKITQIQELEVEQNAFSAADTFMLRLSWFVLDTATVPVVSVDADKTSPLINQDLVPVQIYVGYPENPSNFTVDDLTLIMDGTLDTARWQFEPTGETVTLNGRNKVGDMIDTVVIDKFANQTASAIAARFAKEHGLTPDVTPTTQMAGTYYNQEASLVSPGMSEWDLLLFLAKREHFICRVKGNTLYFGPFTEVVGADNSGNSTPITLTYGYNIERLDLERSPHAARDIQVTVLSYDRNGKQRIKAVASSNTQQASKIAGQLGKRGKYNLVFAIPGLTQAQAQNRAQQILGRYSGTQIIGNVTTAGDTGVVIDRKITLAGVGKGLSTDYFTSKVVHRFSVHDGYTIEVGINTLTDYSATDLADSAPGLTSGASAGNAGSANAITAAANSMGGTQFWANACAIATNRALLAAGIDVRTLGVANTAYAPDYQGIGQTITDPSQFQPGDLVLTGWGRDRDRGGVFDYGHIGIYAGNGQFWNVSTHAGFKWVLTSLPAGQIRAQRL